MDGRPRDPRRSRSASSARSCSRRTATPARTRSTVKVFAQQFAWRFEYPDDGGSRSDELVMPLDRTIKFEMKSADVIHSFWIPQMGQKQDLVPGITDEHRDHADAHGHASRSICTELCGLGHATMRAPRVSTGCVSQAGLSTGRWRRRSSAERRRRGAAATAPASVFAVGRLRRLPRVHAGGDRRGRSGPSLDNLAAAAREGGRGPGRRTCASRSSIRTRSSRRATSTA